MRAGHWRVATLSLLVLGAAAWFFAGRVSVPEPPTAAALADADAPTVSHLAEARLAVVNALRSADAWGQYGEVLAGYEQADDAVACLATAHRLDPDAGRWPYLAGHLTQPSDPAKAAEWFGRALETGLDPAARQAATCRRAECLLAAGEPQSALDALGPAPDGPRAKLIAARAALELGDDRRAAEWLTALAEQSPSRSVWNLRAQLYQRQGRASAAQDAAKRALALGDPAWPDPWVDRLAELNRSRAGRLELAAKRLRERRPAEAVEILAPWLDRTPDARPLLGLAEARLMQGDRPGARAVLERATAEFPDDWAGHYQLGLWYFAEGERLHAAGDTPRARPEFEQAVARLDRALARQPDSVKALLLKGTAQVRFLGQPTAGHDTLKRAAELRPDLLEAQLYHGEALAATGDRAGAVAALRRAAELSAEGDGRAREALKSLSGGPGVGAR